MTLNKYSFLAFIIIMSFFFWAIIPKRLILIPCTNLSSNTNSLISNKLAAISWLKYFNSQNLYKYLSQDLPELKSITIKYKNGHAFLSLSTCNPEIKIDSQILTNNKKLADIKDFTEDSITNIPEIFIGKSITPEQIIKYITPDILALTKEYKIFWLNNTNIILIPAKLKLSPIYADKNSLNLSVIRLAEQIPYVNGKIIDIRFRDMFVIKKLDINKHIKNGGI